MPEDEDESVERFALVLAAYAGVVGATILVSTLDLFLAVCVLVGGVFLIQRYNPRGDGRG